jgi:hypothetical protein
VEIYSHYADDGVTEYITVTEARQTEQIAAELFECPQPWLSVWDFSDDSDGVHGHFKIVASNGWWQYRLTRKIWWLDGVYEAELEVGRVLDHEVHSTA